MNVDFAGALVDFVGAVGVGGTGAAVGGEGDGAKITVWADVDIGDIVHAVTRQPSTSRKTYSRTRDIV